ncbi:MAG: hypothetical protein ACXADH_19030, partial [Candidatus Kariarchaeaceae archaeon]
TNRTNDLGIGSNISLQSFNIIWPCTAVIDDYLFFPIIVIVLDITSNDFVCIFWFLISLIEFLKYSSV